MNNYRFDNGSNKVSMNRSNLTPNVILNTVDIIFGFSINLAFDTVKVKK